MSNASNDLVLHLKLDTIIPDADNQRVRSAFLSENVSALSESQYRIHGNPQVVPDEHFGSCFIFDGNNDYLELPRTNIPSGNEITVCFWANGGNNLPNTNSIVLAQTAKNSRILNINLPWSNKIIYFDCGGNPKDKDSGYDRIGKSVGTGQGTVQYKGKWNHWAFTKDATKGEMKIYLNGILWHYETGKKQTILPAAKVYIAKNYPGKIANFRTYKKALSPEEIKQDMNDDLTATAAFNLAYPLDFDLYEGDNKESIIFIENDAKGEELVFEIANNTEQGITLPAKSGAVSQNNYHFELRFRPDTLSLKSLQQLALKPQSNWSMSSPVSQPDGIVSLYFLTTNTTLPANQTFTLTLQNVSASAEGGARTTRVEFLCPKFTYQGETLTNYYREKNLSVIDHRGKKNIPLHVSFVESNRILNDGHTPNELTLRIVNVLKDKAIPLIPDSKGDKASKFIISFDVQNQNETKEWALLETGQIAGISIKYKGKEIRNSGEQGESPEWVITFNDQTAIEPGQDIQVELSGIVSSLPSGQTNLYIRYENIPGYWDGTFVCTIDKTPILYKQGNVGIGISDPGKFKLNVQGGDINVSGTIYRGGNPLVYENYEIYLRGSAGESFEEFNTFLKIANVSIPMYNNRGLNTTILNPDGSYKDRTTHDVFNNPDSWNAWADWINNPENVAGGDVVAVASYDAINNAPRDGAAEKLLTSMNALRAFDLVKGEFRERSPYVLLFVKGRVGAMEVCQPHRGSNAHLKTTYYELLNYGNTSVVLRGMIIMWSGDVNHIPVGWALCDGQNGTPDLRDRFIVGAGNNYKQGSTGGVDSVELTISQMPAHNHENGKYKYLVAQWPQGWNTATSFDTTPGELDIYAGQPIKTVGGNEAHENRPPYYALSYIMKL